ncbi:MAG: O-acetyl-ADP-ribose deacetylase (regulator of RNase III) [Bradymonadia bacterium]|jgi:O-acetyl-ADP-ribose deacetylase (regulator of RNase III)
MIKDVRGDILLSKAAAIAHGVAPNDHFAHGLALRERWPSMAKDFRHYYHVSHPKPGEMWAWAGAGGVRIINLMTQEPGPDHASGHPGKAKVKHVNHALRHLRQWILDEGIESTAISAVATGVGGLDWNDVKPLVHTHLGDLDATVYIYTDCVPGEQAKEA